MKNKIQSILEAKNYFVDNVDKMELPAPPGKQDVGLITAYYIKAMHKENNNRINQFIFNAEYNNGRKSWLVGEYEVDDVNKAIEKLIWLIW